MMNRLFYSILLACLVLLTGCEKYETYSDMKEKEQDAISSFLASQGIAVIYEATFNAQGQTTDLGSNQFVRFSRNGVYMQIVRKGCGSVLEETTIPVTLLCRFSERNIKTGEMVIRNDIHSYITMSGMGTFDVSNYIDKLQVTRTGTTIGGYFTSGMMLQYHGNQSVPSGWLVPLLYINVGYPENDDDEIAKVRLIVPHSQGTADASSSVTPYYYEITYQRSL